MKSFQERLYLSLHSMQDFVFANKLDVFVLVLLRHWNAAAIRNQIYYLRLSKVIRIGAEGDFTRRD